MNLQQPFKWRHFQQEIILLNVRWYLKPIFLTQNAIASAKNPIASRVEPGVNSLL